MSTRSRSAILTRAGVMALVLALAACVGTGELAPRHTPSAREIPLPSADFAAYVTAAEGAVAGANQGIKQPLAPAVVTERAPFELVPKGGRCPRGANGRQRKAALLIHDLGGTPYEMRDLARAFAADCYLVRAILLPGHGTVPGDLLEVDYRHWIEATSSAVVGVTGISERLVLVGFGLGATLALHHVLSAPPRSGAPLAGLILLAPALGTGMPRAAQRARTGHRPLAPERAWARLLPDTDPVRFESVPRNAQLQWQRLLEEVHASDVVLDLPVFLAISADDVEVDPGAARDWFCRQLSGPRRMLWYTPAPAHGTGCRFIAERSSAAPPEIIDLSHVGLPVAPDNPRYGAHGAYPDCSHYYWENSPNWLICVDLSTTTAPTELRYGEVTEANLQHHLLRRLTFNPDFAAMVGLMLEFLADPSSEVTHTSGAQAPLRERGG